MRLFNLPNHSSHEATEVEFPPALPEGGFPTFKTKKALTQWRADPETNAYFMSGFSGVAPNKRVTEDNPAHAMHALVCDYDGTSWDGNVDNITDETKYTKGAKPAAFPGFVGRTTSGGMRTVYFFEKPMPLPSDPVRRQAFMDAVVAVVRADIVWTGMEKQKTSQYFDCGFNFFPTGAQPIPESVLTTIMTKVAADSGGADAKIPIEDIRERCKEKYPTANVSKLEFGQPCGIFWMGELNKRDSAICFADGIMSFSETAGRRTHKWSQILGPDWVQKYEESRVGDLVKGIYKFKGDYLRRTTAGEFTFYSKGDLFTYLKVQHGVADVRGKKEKCSDMDRVLDAICELNSVDYLFPFLFDPRDVVEYDDKRILNITRNKLVQPLTDTVEWGDGFPFIARLIDRLFVDPSELQKAVFLRWLQIFYGSALKGKLRRGHNIWLCGSPGAGKSYLNKVVIAQLMGGGVDASSFLAAGDQFNDSLFNKSVWMMDDAVIVGSRVKMDQTIKKVCANELLSFRAMRQSAITMPWQGRVTTTMNDDMESLQMLPTADPATLDKALLFRLKNPAMGCAFPSDDEIMKELPAFGAYIRDYVVPDEFRDQIMGDGEDAEVFRWGMKAFHHPTLLIESHDLSRDGTIRGALEEWRDSDPERVPRGSQYDPETKTWTGSAAQIQGYFTSMGDALLSAHVIAKHKNTQTLGYDLKKIADMSDVDWMAAGPRKRGTNSWVISFPR